MSFFNFDSLNSERPPRGRTRSAPLWVVLLGLCLFGCSKEDISNMASTVKQTGGDLAESTKNLATAAVEKVEDTVEDKLPPTGKVSLMMTPPVELEVARVEVISVGDGRDNIVQITTYDTGKAPAKFPAVLIHGRTTVSSASALAGQTVPCDLYFQASYSTPVAMTPTGKLVDVTFTAVNAQAKTVTANLKAVTLLGADNSQVTINGGSIEAVITGEGS